jgi:hypothetical protein
MASAGLGLTATKRRLTWCRNPMDSNRQTRIQLLSRMTRRKAASSEFLARLSEVLGRKIESSAIVSIQDSDSLLEIFRLGYRAAQKDGAISYRKFFDSREENLVIHLAECLADRLNSEEAFFLTKLGGDTDAVNVDISALLKRAKAAIAFDGDSISIVSKDKGQGLLIDYNPDDSVQRYEIAVWGDRWPLLIVSCEADGSDSRQGI